MLISLCSSLLFGVSASLDALLVGISLGLRKSSVSFLQNLFISMITLLGTCLSIELGTWILPLLPDSTGSLIGCCILILFGSYYLIKSIKLYCKKFHRNHSHRNSIESSSVIIDAIPPAKTISIQLPFREILVLSVALSTNNAGIGLSASMAGLSLLPTAVATFFCSVGFLAAGIKLGKCHLLQLSDAAADLLSGFLILCLGIASLFF